ncbi:hypothetical protein ACN2CC_03715 [Mesorhizobium muleiense]|uniref:hypothetical protein n=1 Tax=Mesorhizobium muleiense TaxID=1004279 RepID=UPI003AFA41DF
MRFLPVCAIAKSHCGIARTRAHHPEVERTPLTNASKYLLATVAATAIAAVAVASTAPASACEAGGKHHHPAASGTDEPVLDIKSAPADLSKTLGDRGPQTMRVDLETMEANGKLEDGVSYNYRTPARTNP